MRQDQASVAQMAYVISLLLMPVMGDYLQSLKRVSWRSRIFCGKQVRLRPNESDRMGSPDDHKLH